MINFKFIVVGVLIMLVLDLIWIGGFMSGFYKDNLKHFLKFGESGNLSPRLIPTILVYVAGSSLLYFFVLPLVQTSIGSGNSIFVAALWGALAGLLVYSFYDLTNLALFEKWNVLVTVVDIVWGAFLFYITTLLLLLL